ncbi:hypothetical protein [Peribacillus faecalis]|nr:hypothetical protein [Peribacillus faecalis]
MVKRFLALFLFLSGFLFVLNMAPSTSYACSCAEPGPVEEELERSAAVFRGEVKAVVDEKAGNAFQSSADRIAYIIKVDKIWKGIQETEVVVYSERDSASCGFNFAEGQEYLIYANQSGDELHVIICSRTADLFSAEEDLSILGEGEKPTKSVTIEPESLQEADWRTIDVLAVLILGLAVLGAYFVYRSRKN